MKTKICSKCKEEKSITEFHKNKNHKDGLAHWCKECCKEYHKKYYQENREKLLKQSKEYSREYYQKKKAFVINYKVNKGCIVCGIKHPAVLEFHHRDPNKKEIMVSLLMRGNYSIKKIKNEIKKCDVICRNCHAILHWEEKVKTF